MPLSSLTAWGGQDKPCAARRCRPVIPRPWGPSWPTVAPTALLLACGRPKGINLACLWKSPPTSHSINSVNTHLSGSCVSETLGWDERSNFFWKVMGKARQTSQQLQRRGMLPQICKYPGSRGDSPHSGRCWVKKKKLMEAWTQVLKEEEQEEREASVVQSLRGNLPMGR